MGLQKGTEQPGGRQDDFIQLYNLFTVLRCSSSSGNKQRKAGHSSLWDQTQTNYNGNCDQIISLSKDLIHDGIFIKSRKNSIWNINLLNKAIII